jgi:D-glycero-D-manno-heptose 1,7-bisphosphate phosphatase
MKKAVFLDRDGVINKAFVRNGKPYPPKNIAELEILPGVLSALEMLHKANFMLIVVTNQPDVARGDASRVNIENINNYLKKCLPIDEFRTCFHDDGDNCDCRKPLPGSLILAANEHYIDLKKSFMIGDRWRDIEAGQRVGCKAFFVDYGYNEKQPESNYVQVSNLSEAAQFILKGDNEKN